MLINTAPILGIPAHSRCGDACQEGFDDLFSENQQGGDGFETLRERLIMAPLGIN